MVALVKAGGSFSFLPKFSIALDEFGDALNGFAHALHGFRNVYHDERLMLQLFSLHGRFKVSVLFLYSRASDRVDLVGRSSRHFPRF